MVIGFVQVYEELRWGISKLNPLCNGPLPTLRTCMKNTTGNGSMTLKCGSPVCLPKIGIILQSFGYVLYSNVFVVY